MLNKSVQQLFLPLCLLLEGSLMFFQEDLFLLLPGWGKGVLPTKKRLEEAWPLIELILIRTSVSPLHPSTPWSEIAAAHIHTAKFSLLLLALVGRSSGCPLLCSNTLQAADCLPARHTSIQIPAENEGQRFPDGFPHRMKRPSFGFSLLLWDEVSHWRKNTPYVFHLKKREEVSFSFTQQQMGSGTHAVTEKGSSNTVPLREDRRIVTFRGDEKTPGTSI